jgi:hypothetical protein
MNERTDTPRTKQGSFAGCEKSDGSHRLSETPRLHTVDDLEAHIENSGKEPLTPWTNANQRKASKDD